MQYNFIYSVSLMLNGVYSATLSLSSFEVLGVTKYFVFFIQDNPKPVNHHRTFTRKSSAYKYFNFYLSKLNKSLI